MVGDPKQAIYSFRGADIGSYAQALAAIERQWPDNIVQVTANFRSRPDILAHINRCLAHPLSIGSVRLEAMITIARYGRTKRPRPQRAIAMTVPFVVTILTD